MEECLNLSKNRLTNLNQSFLTTIQEGESPFIYQKKFSNSDKYINQDDTQKVCENGKKYLYEFDNMEKKEKKKNSLKLVAANNEYRTIIHPSYIRENSFKDDKKYINLSFVNDIIKIPKDEIRSRERNGCSRKYNFTYNDKKKKNNYEYINATNEYYITKNVQEKMSNTGITTENFFCDNDMLVYEDDMKKWNDKSRYLYFIDKEKENNGNKKKTKFKSVHFNDSVLVDKYERIAYKNDVISDKVKIENLILDILNNNFDDIESDEDKKPQVPVKAEQEEDEKLEIKKKEEELNITKKKRIKENKTNILDYLHYDNFFYDENADRISESLVSDNSDNSNNSYDQKNIFLKNYTSEKKEEEDIKNNVNNLLIKVKKDLNIKNFTDYIPEQFNTEIFLSDHEKYHKYETDHNQKSNQVLTEEKIETNEEKMKEELELLQKYSYVDSLYSPGYYTRITQNLKKKLKEEKINIYDLKKKKIYDKIKEDMLEDEKMKKEEENLTKLRLENIKIYEDNLLIEEPTPLDNNGEQSTILNKAENEREEIYEDDVVDEETNESEDSIKTNSSLSFEYLDYKSIDELKKKYKAMKKSDRVYEEDLRKLKFYICNRLNKKKYILKSKKSDKTLKKKKKNIKKAMKFSKEAGYNLLANIHRDNQIVEKEEGEEEEDESEESELFEDGDKDPFDLNSSEYTYSSLTISSYEYVNIRNVHYNENSNESIFYYKDPKINITYLYGYVDFFLINNDTRTSKGNLFFEIYVYHLKMYENSTHISEDGLLYSLYINENTTANIKKRDADISEIILKVDNEDGAVINCCFSGNSDQINLIFNNIITRVLLSKYTKYVDSISARVYENVAYYFLLENSILNLENIEYDRNADEIICSHKKKIKNLNSINFSDRKMNILNLYEFLTFSNIKQCNTLIMKKNPLFLNLSLDTIKNDIDHVVMYLKNIDLKELILDFVDLSTLPAAYFISNLIINTNISFLSFMNCELNEDSIANIIKNIKEEKEHISSSINYLNIEFNNLKYFDILALIRILYELNNDFKKLYIYGNLIQRDIFDISYEFKRKKVALETNKYFKQIPNIFSFNNIYEIKNYFYCNLRGCAQFYDNDKSMIIYFELYSIYLYVLKPETKLYIIKNISIAKKDDISFILIGALYNNREIKFRLKLFKHNITLLFYNTVNESFLGKLYYYEQTNNNREINENILNYFIMRSENEINFYHYNINKEEIDFILKLCKNSIVKILNLSYCYLTNEDILHFNSIKGSKYGIKVYKLFLNNNFINSNLPIEELITFISNFNIYFKINLSDLKIGSSPNIHELFFYLLNNTKCKIINLNNCNLGNNFLINVNKNIEKLNENNYVNLLLLQYNSFHNEKELIKFLNYMILKCKSLDKIRIYSNYLNEENCADIINYVSQKKIVSFQHTYDLPTYKRNLKKKVSKLKKNKINNDIEYNMEITENERKIIEQFFEKKHNRERTIEKKDLKFKSRYNLVDLKNRKIKYKFDK